MKMETNLRKYNKGQKILIDKLSNGKYTYAEATERCSKLWNLIPSCMEVNPVRLNNLMKERFGSDPDWSKYCMTFKIDINSEFFNNEFIAEVIRTIANKKRLA
jgi:hypothetical protein